ncbi:biotin synthase BioB [Rubinisphaera sp.]|uniref:biotin synthase BioB n=1 Tax=Rubinisphaera sp. TaxID=2024857 RepID=UPI000C0C9C50|nr:biotin synthase BioB [Rubinisphaera sp.]MBV12348.1 biotin synthase BioB [Rubinisphaera sp.]|tara:strand:+ start:2460 stop:3485 length:1026 start_codon:yes stop_codon:yes gene_type:complete
MISQSQAISWNELADSVLNGGTVDDVTAHAILDCPNEELLGLLQAAFRVRHQYFGNQVQLYYLKNAKSGLCPEDCGYCSQSKVSDAPIEKYAWLNEEKLLAGARQAKENQAKTYCIVASGRGPTNREVEHVAKVAKRIKEELGMHLCCCLGLLKPEQAQVLADAGVDRINHNLNTSRELYDKICTTHTYQDRIDTLKVAQAAGMELCSGIIVGMGETHDDLIRVTNELRELNVKSIPVNFLTSIEGTPLENVSELDPQQCLKALCLFRFTNPSTELRIAGGREIHLRTLQPLGLYPANSMFVSDYLTTKGQTPSEDYQIIKDLGFEVVTQGFESEKPTELV